MANGDGVARRAGHRLAWAACTGGTAAYLVVARADVLALRVVPLVVALAGYGALLAAMAGGWRPDGRSVLRASLLLLALAVALPPLHSRDVYVHGMQGRIVAVHHASPYHHEAGDFAGDPFLSLVPDPYHHGRSSYGPVFTGAETVGATVAAGSPLVTRLWFQGLAALAVAASLVLLRRTGDGAAAVAFLGLNPLVAGKAVNEGHPDVLLGALVLAAVVMAGRRRPLVAAAVVAVACLVKVLAVACLVGLLAWVLAHRGWRAAAGAGLVAAGVVVVGYLAVGGMAALEPLRDTATFQSRTSIWAQPRLQMTLDMVEQGMTGTDAGLVARRTVARLALVTVAAVGALVVLALRRRPQPALPVAGAFVCYLLGGVYAPAWYVAAVLPTLALVRASRLAVLTVVHGGLLALAYVYSAHLAHDPLGGPLRLLYTWVVPAFEVAALLALAAWSVNALLRGRRHPSPGAPAAGPPSASDVPTSAVTVVAGPAGASPAAPAQPAAEDPAGGRPPPAP